MQFHLGIFVFEVKCGSYKLNMYISYTLDILHLQRMVLTKLQLDIFIISFRLKVLLKATLMWPPPQ